MKRLAVIGAAAVRRRVAARAERVKQLTRRERQRSALGEPREELGLRGARLDQDADPRRRALREHLAEHAERGHARRRKLREQLLRLGSEHGEPRIVVP
jgi:hypothetical protein